MHIRHMEEFIKYLRQFAIFSGEECSLIAAHTKLSSISTGHYALDVEETPRCLPFVTGGVFRIGACDKRGEEHTRRFVTEGHFALDIFTVERAKPSRYFVQAVVDSTLLTISLAAMRQLSAAIDMWDTAMVRIGGAVLVESALAESAPRGIDATTRFKTFEKIHPGLCDRIGLAPVASHLRISTATLSRLRGCPGRRYKFPAKRPPDYTWLYSQE